jgi:hypothetical protein
MHQTTCCCHHCPFPSFEGCEACSTQPGCYRQQGRPHQGETREVHRLCTPAMLSLTHPSRHVTQNPNPQQQATATGPRYHDTRHTTHQTMTVSAAGPRTQHTAQLPPRPQTRRVTSMFLPARPHQCPLHQPGPLHAGQVATAPQTHAPARPTPCKCRQCPTPIPVPCSPDATASPQHTATTQHCPAAPTPRLGGRTTGRSCTPALIPPTTCAANTPPAICWRCWRAGRTREFRRLGHLYQSCRCRRLAPPAPVRGRVIYTI